MIYLSEIEQSISTHRNIDKKTGADRISTDHRKRSARLGGRIKLLKHKYKLCKTLRCQKIIKSQIVKWRLKQRREMFKKPIGQTTKIR